MQHLVHGVETGTDGEGISRTSLGRSIHLLILDARILQFSQESIHEDILPGEHQRRKHRVVIIPAPAFAQQIRILHRAVGIHLATNGIYTHLLQAVDKGREVIAVETGIHAAHTIYIAMEHTLLDGSRIFQLGFKLIGPAQLVQRRDGRKELHRASRAHQLALIVLVDAGVILQVPNHDTHLRSFKHLAFQQIVDTHLHRLRPRQSQRIGSQRV